MYVGNCVGEGNVFIVSLYQRCKGLSRNMHIAEEWCRVYRAGRRELEREVTDKIRKSFHALLLKRGQRHVLLRMPRKISAVL